MKARARCKFWLLVWAMCVLGADQSFSQATTGTIGGTVRDAHGAIVVGATIRVRKLDTNLERSLLTESDGRFLFAGLPIGPYELVAEHTGFAHYTRGPILLLLNQDALVDPLLEVAAASTTVNVSDDAPVLNRTSPEVGVLMSGGSSVFRRCPRQGEAASATFSHLLSRPLVSVSSTAGTRCVHRARTSQPTARAFAATAS